MKTTIKTDCEFCGKAFTQRKSKRFCSTTCRAKAHASNTAPVTKESLVLTLNHLRNLYEKSKNKTPEAEAKMTYAMEIIKEIQSYKEYQ
jgi:hypothetical protein